MLNINEEHMQEVIDMFTDADFLYGTFKTINYLGSIDLLSHFTKVKCDSLT